MSGFSNPFVAPEHWANLKETLSPREYDRRVLALDVRPERALYTSWDRKESVRVIPRVGARDVTAEVLKQHGDNRVLLIGHDPGQIQDVSVLLKAYRMSGDTKHVWFVVDEFVTPRTTTEEHVKALRDHVRARWQCNLPDPYRKAVVDQLGKQAHVRIDPWGKSDAKPDLEVYQIFQKYGFDAKSASYVNGEGRGRIPQESRIEMINRLLLSASGKRRLFIAANDRGEEVAPQLARALEVSERDELGRPEQAKKDNKTKDLTDFTTSLAYAVWPFERFIRPHEAAS